MGKQLEIQEINFDVTEIAEAQKIAQLEDLTLAIIGGGDMTVNF